VNNKSIEIKTPFLGL